MTVDEVMSKLMRGRLMLGRMRRMRRMRGMRRTRRWMRRMRRMRRRMRMESENRRTTMRGRAHIT